MSARFKFRCGACGQRISVKPEDYGTKADCPTCGAPLTVPTPSAPPELLARLEEEGIAFRPSRLVGEHPDLHSAMVIHTGLITEFFAQLAALRELVGRLVSEGEISSEPPEIELRVVGKALFARVMDGDWGGTEEDLRELLFDTLPAIRG